MKLIYLSGPMSGIKDFNYPAFAAAAAELRDLGYNVISPHELSEPSSTCSCACQSWHSFMRTDIRMLMECSAVFAIPGWRKSRGAVVEIAIANAFDMPVFDYESDSHRQYEPSELPKIQFDGKPKD